MIIRPDCCSYSRLIWHSQPLDLIVHAKRALIKGLVCPAYYTCVKLQESCKINQIALLLISA